MAAVALPTNAFDLQEHYDQYAGMYDDLYRQYGYMLCVLGGKFVSKNYTNKTGRILDMGCGTGMLAQELSKMQYTNLEGCDLSTGMIQEADKKGVYKTLFQQDLLDFPYVPQDNTYDLSVCIGVNHLISRWKEVLQEMARITKPGGMVIVSQRSKYIEMWDYPGMMKDFEERGVLKVLDQSTPVEYCPGHPERVGNDRLLVFYACRVL